jgi:hypothetical protein
MRLLRSRLLSRGLPSGALRRRSLGQAMIEYVVVLAFGVILLTKADASGLSPVEQLAKAIRDYHKHYSYAMAIATIPDCSYEFNYEKTPYGDYKFSVSATIDRCPDWENFEFPIEDLSITEPFGILDGNFSNIVKNAVNETINGFIDKFSNPGNLLKDLFSFDLGSFF